jgi:hypothetical protein
VAQGDFGTHLGQIMGRDQPTGFIPLIAGAKVERDDDQN